VDVLTCRICGFSLVDALDWGGDLHAGLCGECAGRKAALKYGGAAHERCEWCSEPGPLTAYRHPDEASPSRVCARCHRYATARER
jgi:hypothetical protein